MLVEHPRVDPVAHLECALCQPRDPREPQDVDQGVRVVGFDPSVWFGPKEVRRVDRFGQLTVAAAAMALEDAGAVDVDPERAGVIMGTGAGGIETSRGAGRISIASPVGRAMLDRQVGEEIEVAAPIGTVKYQIERIL